MIEFNQGSNYTGKVNIKLLHNNSEVLNITQHNNGTKAFLEYIANVVSGQVSVTTKPGLIPGKLGFLGANIPLVSYSDIRATKYDNENNYSYYSLQFVIPSSYINKGDTFSELCLFPLNVNSFDESQMYASIKLDKDIVVDDSNMSLIVEWVLAFSNY